MNDELKWKILQARDERVDMIESWLPTNQVILTLKANYPGIEKDNRWTSKIVETFHRVILDTFDVLKITSMNVGEGLVYVYLIDSKDLIHIKKYTVNLEEQHEFGRLVDLDVYQDSIKPISRSEIGMKKRTCFLCDQDAFFCIKAKNHTLDEIEMYIKRVVDTNG